MPRLVDIVTQMDTAIAALLASRSQNEWFLKTFWPEVEERTRLALADIRAHVPPPAAVLDVGCYDGFVCELLTHLGYRVTGSDAWADATRDRRFAELGIEFVRANFNEPEPFSALTDGTFDAVFMGEVIEHVLHHPLGFLREVRRLSSPEACLALTTPNPSTVMNAWRLLTDRYTLWGTDDFMNLPKYDNGKAIDVGHIHYREYTQHELRELLRSAGFTILTTRFMPVGPTRQQSRAKRLIKQSRLAQPLLATRLFGRTQYVLARAST